MGVALGLGGRAVWAGGLAAVLAGAALLAAYAGVKACAPPTLSGDEGWMRGYLAGQALALLTGQVAADCAQGPGRGETLLAAVPVLRALALAVPLLALLWEVAGWPLRLAFLRRRGGHAVLAGPPAVVEPLAPAVAWRVWLLPEGSAAEAGLWPPTRCWRHRLAAGPGVALAGPGRAALVVAAMRDDLANFRLARRALDEGCTGRVLVQIEARTLRSLGAETLRDEAERRGARLTIVAPHLLQAREALALAMPGRYRDDGAGGAVHLCVCGDGAGVDDMIARLARQGYGLEHQRPRLSVLRVGARPPGAAAEATPWADDLLELTEQAVPAEDPGRIDTAIAGVAATAPRLSAVFCTSAVPGVAQMLARRWERVLADLGLPVPPLVALDEGETGPEPGLAVTAACPRLDGIERGEARLDARAKAVHAHYLALTAGAGPAGLPSQRPWADLAERYRDDNRAAADHLPFKLARIGVALRPAAAGRGLAALEPAEVENLAEAEHARWAASRRVAGWTLGPRDDAALTHPDLLPYADLDEAAKDKDRDQVARLPAVAARAGEALVREWPVRAGPGRAGPGRAGPVWAGPGGASAVVAALDAAEAHHPDRVPVLHGGLADDDLAALKAAQAAGHLTALVIDEATPPADWTPLARAVRRGAYRLRVTADPGAVLAALGCIDTLPDPKVAHAEQR